MRPAFLPLLTGILILSYGVAEAGDAALPKANSPITRYMSLWVNSPFRVSTLEEAPKTAAYTLCGIAQIDGVSYASLIDNRSNEHFLIATNAPSRGLVLVSIVPGNSADGPQAFLRKNGESIALCRGSVPQIVPTMDFKHFSRYPGRMAAPAE